MIPKMNIIETEVWVSDSVNAISMEVEYPDHDMIEHDMMYILYETGEPSEGGVTFDEAYELALQLKHINDPK